MKSTVLKWLSVPLVAQSSSVYVQLAFSPFSFKGITRWRVLKPPKKRNRQHYLPFNTCSYQRIFSKFEKALFRQLENITTVNQHQNIQLEHSREDQKRLLNTFRRFWNLELTNGLHKLNRNELTARFGKVQNSFNGYI